MPADGPMPADGRTTLDKPAKFGPRGIWGRREAQLIALATRQHGVVAISQLRSLGLTTGAIRHRVAVGRLHAVHAGIYALGRPDVPVEGRWMGAVLACGPDALLSHRSAAALHGLLPTSQSAIDVTVPRRVGISRPGISVHRPTCVVFVDRATARGIPCTSVARTLLDLAAVAPRGVLEKACDQAEVTRVLDWSAIHELVSRARGRRGVRNLRAILARAGSGDVTRSELERRFIALCRHEGLPHPAVNEWLTVGGEEMQVDFLWRDERVIVETDGYATHGTRQAFRRDRRRDRMLALAGWRVARFTWEEVTEEPTHVTAVVRKLLAGVSGLG
jgi:very-short-patch-repair endonuclease